MTLRVKVFTVPGQVLHASTRRLVLQGADGVAFIADSQISETEHNAASFLDLRQNLAELNLSLKQLPLVIQFNKRDLDRVRSDDEIGALARRGREPVFKASAVNGQGVLETFFGLLHLTWTRLDGEHQLAKMIGVESAQLLPTAARLLGLTGDVSTLLSACVGGNLDRHSKVPA
jgi:signal recognition particle receptor subunit beta